MQFGRKGAGVPAAVAPMFSQWTTGARRAAGGRRKDATQRRSVGGEVHAVPEKVRVEGRGRPARPPASKVMRVCRPNRCAQKMPAGNNASALAQTRAAGVMYGRTYAGVGCCSAAGRRGGQRRWKAVEGGGGVGMRGAAVGEGGVVACNAGVAVESIRAVSMPRRMPEDVMKKRMGRSAVNGQGGVLAGVRWQWAGRRGAVGAGVATRRRKRVARRLAVMRESRQRWYRKW